MFEIIPGSMNMMKWIVLKCALRTLLRLRDTDRDDLHIDVG